MMAFGGRSLTLAEAELAGDVFKGCVDLDQVRLHKQGERLNRMTGGRSFALGNHIVLSDYWYNDDFSDLDIDGISHLAHELVHVWQYQNDIDVVGQFLKLRREFNGDYNLAYDVSPDDLARDFSTLNTEQQAMLVQDSVRLRGGGRPYFEWFSKEKAEPLMRSAFG